MKTRMFSIHIPVGNVVKYSKEDWDRLVRFVEEHCEPDTEITSYRDPIGRSWCFTGVASRRVISILMAVARGHDLTALLDEFEKENT